MTKFLTSQPESSVVLASSDTNGKVLTTSQDGSLYLRKVGAKGQRWVFKPYMHGYVISSLYTGNMLCRLPDDKVFTQLPTTSTDNCVWELDGKGTVYQELKGQKKILKLASDSLYSSRDGYFDGGWLPLENINKPLDLASPLPYKSILIILALVVAAYLIVKRM